MVISVSDGGGREGERERPAGETDRQTDRHSQTDYAETETDRQPASQPAS